MIETQHIEVQKLDLIEELGGFYERYHTMTPVAGRIFALLRINARGTSFDEILTTVKASKSTVSTNLKQLELEGRIEFHTKPGDRKRYFLLSGTHFVANIEKEMVRLQTELELNTKIVAFKKEANTMIPNKEDRFVLPSNPSPYASYLNKSIELLNTLKLHISTCCKPTK